MKWLRRKKKTEPGYKFTNSEDLVIPSSFMSMNEVRELMVKKVYVSLLLPHSDKSGQHKILGVYSNPTAAEACCYRELMDLGYYQPTDVIKCDLDPPFTPI